MKLRSSLLALPLFLVACSGGSSSVACEQTYWDGVFGTCLPAGWSVVDRETLRQRGVPEETITAFQTDEAVSGQFPTVTVTREQLSQPASPSQYSEASVRAVEVLPGYERVETKSTKIDAGDVTLHIFSLQPVQDEPRRRFYQESTAVEDIGYSITATSPLTVDSGLEDEILLILSKATFTEPVAE